MASRQPERKRAAEIAIQQLESAAALVTQASEVVQDELRLGGRSVIDLQQSERLEQVREDLVWSLAQFTGLVKNASTRRTQGKSAGKAAANRNNGKG